MRKDAWLAWGWMLAFLLYGLVLAAQPDAAPEWPVSVPSVIWGNRRSGIYHLPSCRHYPTPQQVKAGPHWQPFPSPDAAEQAGYRRALTCPR